MNELHGTKFISIPAYSEVLERIADFNYYRFLDVVLEFKSDFDEQNEPFPIFVKSNISSFHSRFEETVRDMCRKGRINNKKINECVDFFNFHVLSTTCKDFEDFHAQAYQMYFSIIELIAKDVAYQELMLKLEELKEINGDDFYDFVRSFKQII